MVPELKFATTYFFDWNLERIARCLGELNDEQVWSRPNANSNSIGNQILHLSGNIRQWIISGLGGGADTRTREAEFAAEGGWTKQQLLEHLTQTIEEAKQVVRAQTEEQLLRERPVQAYVHDGVFIVMHVTEHLSYHTGQIIFWTKALQNLDLDFYGDVDLG
jgi:uncharacterized damage-inducible protein DinB